MTEAYIYDALRTPRGKGRKDGSLHEVTALRLSAQTLNAVKERNNLEGHAVEDVIWGNVTQVMEQGGCLARSAVLASDLDERIPGLAINRFCASGMEAVNLAANQVKGGAGAAYIAGGVEMMGRVAMGSDGAAIAVDPSIAMEQYFVPQGISADIIATEYGFSRDDADQLAMASQQRAKAAWDDNRFDGSVITVRDQNGIPILDHDEYMRPQTDMQSLGGLNPAFEAMGTTMPGFDKIALMKYPHLERINHIHHAGMSINDIDLFEVNEAFASVVLRFMQAFDVDHDKVNVNGGSIAMGHPLGATGAIIIGTLLDELERSGKGTGLATLCIASGMGAATIIERV